MGKLRDYIQKLDAVTKEAQLEAILEIIRRNVYYLVDLNTGQLMMGIDANGEKLKEYANAVYAAFKKHLNPLGVTDLKVTGDFHSGFYADMKQFPITFWSTDEKTDELVYEYGKDIFGLTEESKDLFIQQIYQEVIEYYRSIIVP